MPGNSRILCIEPDPLYRAVFEKMFLDTGIRARFLDDPAGMLPEDALAGDVLLANYIVDGRPAFELLPLIRARRPDLPVILFCDGEVDDLVGELSRHEKVNIMSRPFTREELLFFLDKLLHPSRAFGLGHYLKQGAEVKTFILRDSLEVRPLIETVLEAANEWGFDFDYDFKIDLVLHELFLNALYHAYGYEEEKKRGEPIRLSGDEIVEIEVGHDENRFGVTITDFRGNLSRARILQSLHDLEQQKSVDRLLAEGRSISDIFRQHGRGIDIVLRNTGEYYFVIEKGRRTQAIIVFDKHYEKDDAFSSIKVIEVAPGS